MLDGILHVGPLDKYSKISSRTQVSNHKYFQSVIYLLHYLCLLCFESQHCTEDDVGELMLAGKEKATLVQLRNISAGLWSTNLDFLHQLNAVTAPERNNILITIVIAMITFHWFPQPMLWRAILLAHRLAQGPVDDLSLGQQGLSLRPLGGLETERAALPAAVGLHLQSFLAPILILSAE